MTPVGETKMPLPIIVPATMEMPLQRPRDRCKLTPSSSDKRGGEENEQEEEEEEALVVVRKRWLEKQEWMKESSIGSIATSL